jgi:hypothetical protein
MCLHMATATVIAEKTNAILAKVSKILDIWSRTFRAPAFYLDACSKYFAGEVGVINGFKVAYQANTPASPIIPSGLTNLMTRNTSSEPGPSLNTLVESSTSSYHV